jgi:hypothetical protein
MRGSGDAVRRDTYTRGKKALRPRVPLLRVPVSPFPASPLPRVSPLRPPPVPKLFFSCAVASAWGGHYNAPHLKTPVTGRLAQK